MFNVARTFDGKTMMLKIVRKLTSRQRESNV